MENFDSLEPKREQFTIGSTKYELREADASAAKVYRSAALFGVEMETNDSDGKRVTKKLQGVVAVEPLLVSLCLFECLGPAKDDAGTEIGPDRWRPVSLAIIDKWPERIVKRLHDRAKEISELDERDDLPSLERQLATLQRRIERARGDLAKNGQRAGAES